MRALAIGATLLHSGRGAAGAFAPSSWPPDDAETAATRDAVLAHCGKWCRDYIALHDRMTAKTEAEKPRYLEIDCATYSCGGWGNILLVAGQWAVVAYLAGRAAVVRFPANYGVSTWADSPFFRSTAPPSRGFWYTYGGEWIQTWVLRRGDDPEQVHRRVSQLSSASHTSALFTKPLTVVQADTVPIMQGLLRNPHVRAKLVADGFPTHWLPLELLPDLMTFLLFHPTPRLRASLEPFLARLTPGPQLPYVAVHVRTGDASMAYRSEAALHILSYKAIDWSCVRHRVQKRAFFLAADGNTTVTHAIGQFGAQVVVTSGAATHMERDAQFYEGDAGLAAKMYLDFFLLAYAEPPIVRNSRLSSFSVAAGKWGYIARTLRLPPSDDQGHNSSIDGSQDPKHAAKLVIATTGAQCSIHSSSGK